MRQRLSMANRGRLFAMLALALVVRALVPTGWMPVATDQGIRFELCAGQAMPPAAGMHHRHKGESQQTAPDHVCAFAGLGLAADTAPPPVMLALAPAPVPVAAPRALTVAIGRGLAAPPPPATGPPAFA